jgi:hypothetical protein
MPKSEKIKLIVVAVLLGLFGIYLLRVFTPIFGTPQYVKLNNNMQKVSPEITELDIYNHEKTLKNLKYFENLSRLDISSAKDNEKLTKNDFKIISENNLTFLYISFGESNSWESVALLKNLENFHIIYCDFSDIKSLYGLNLTEMDFLYCEVSEIPDLSGFSELVSMDCTGNKITDISNLPTAENLRNVNLSGNPIEDYSPLLEMKNLGGVYVTEGELSEEIKKVLTSKGVVIDEVRKIPADKKKR